MENNPRNASRMFFLIALLLLLPAACSKKPDSSAPKGEPKAAANAVSQENRDVSAVPNDHQTPPDTTKDADIAPTQPRDRTLYDEGKALAEAGRNDEARKKFEDAVNLNPRNALALNYLAKYELDDGNKATAKEYLLRAVNADPEVGEIWNNLSVITMSLGEKDWEKEAVQCMRQAVSLSPDVTAFQFNLGNLLVRVGRPEEAIPYLKTVSDATGNPVAAANLKLAEEMAEKNLIQRQISPAPQQPSE